MRMEAPREKKEWVMNKTGIREKIKKAKEHVAANKKAYIVAGISVTIIGLQNRGLRNLNKFLEEKGLTNEFYHLDEELAEEFWPEVKVNHVALVAGTAVTVGAMLFQYAVLRQLEANYRNRSGNVEVPYEWIKDGGTGTSPE